MTDGRAAAEAERESPAAKAVRLLGVKSIAWKCGLTTDAVYKWPGRSGGVVPARHQKAVLELAREQQVAITAADLIGLAA